MVKILFIIFMILTPILLLNMLIASMGNTYQRIITISERERIRQVCSHRSRSIEEKAKTPVIILSSGLSWSSPSSGLALPNNDLIIRVHTPLVLTINAI